MLTENGSVKVLQIKIYGLAFDALKALCKLQNIAFKLNIYLCVKEISDNQLVCFCLI